MEDQSNIAKDDYNRGGKQQKIHGGDVAQSHSTGTANSGRSGQLLSVGAPMSTSSGSSVNNSETSSSDDFCAELALVQVATNALQQLAQTPEMQSSKANMPMEYLPPMR